MATPVTPGPPEAGPDHPKGSRREKETTMSNPKNTAVVPTLADVDHEVAKKSSLSPTRRRDLRSAISRVAALSGEEPAHLPLELSKIAERLATINPVAVGMTAKTLANVRSDFLAAVRHSGLRPVLASAKSQLSPAWVALMARLSAKRHRLGLSRLARHASAAGVEPGDINDPVINRFIGAVRQDSLHHNPNVLHRNVATIWNEVVGLAPDAGLSTVGKPSFRRPPKRIAWGALTGAFHNDVDKYLTWCAGADAFADDARPRHLRPRTLKLRRNQIHAAVTALVDSGVAPGSINGLGDLVSLDHFRRVLRRRNEEVGGKENNFNRDLAEALVQIGREWVKADAATLAELKKFTSKVPMPKRGLTAKNRRALNQFDDPAVAARLHDLPPQLWREVKRDPKPNFRTLAKAQAALGIAMLTYIPLRPHNLHGLIFDEHVFLRGHSTSSLEIPADEVKNKETTLAFDIPPYVAKMLIEYRDRIAPKVVGRRPDRIFVNADGTPKSQAMVALLIKNTLRKRAGIELTTHQFRHLSAKTVLDDQPGAHETVRQLLGHKNMRTTTWFYSGMRTRHAGLHHQRLIDEEIAKRKPYRRGQKPKKKPSESEKGEA
jgi:integrase